MKSGKPSRCNNLKLPHLQLGLLRWAWFMLTNALLPHSWVLSDLALHKLWHPPDSRTRQRLSDQKWLRSLSSWQMPWLCFCELNPQDLSSCSHSSQGVESVTDCSRQNGCEKKREFHRLTEHVFLLVFFFLAQPLLRCSGCTQMSDNAPVCL